jgi:hypothetical protein
MIKRICMEGCSKKEQRNGGREEHREWGDGRPEGRNCRIKEEGTKEGGTPSLF